MESEGWQAGLVSEKPKGMGFDWVFAVLLETKADRKGRSLGAGE